MANHPLNLAVRFFLELAMLAAAGVWGWQQRGDWLRFVLALLIPLVAATLWGVFRVPNDPGSAPVAVPGVIRLALELALLAFVTWALFDIGSTRLGLIFGLVVAIHYVISYDRIWWIIRQ
jgi:hypothetical protein